MYFGNYPSGVSHDGQYFSTVDLSDSSSVAIGFGIKSADPTTYVDNENTIASKFKLLQNYPNPFNPRTTIRWQLKVASEIELSIYDIVGRKVETLVSGFRTAGEYQLEWDGGNYASGIYFYRLTADNHMVMTRKMALVK